MVYFFHLSFFSLRERLANVNNGCFRVHLFNPNQTSSIPLKLENASTRFKGFGHSPFQILQSYDASYEFPVTLPICKTKSENIKRFEVEQVCGLFAR